MLKIVEQLLDEILHGHLVSINRSNEKLDDSHTLAHYDFNIKQNNMLKYHRAYLGALYM